LFQIFGEVESLESGMQSVNVKEWSPGRDAVEDGHPVIGQQRFSISWKNSRRIILDKKNMFNVAVRSRMSLNRFSVFFIL
jgi:hypothetical protein